MNKEIPFDPKVVEAEENLLIDYQFLLQERMSQKRISQSALADRAGISKARLSQILSDGANPTVKTFADLFFAMGERVRVSSESLLADAAFEPHGLPVSDWEWVQSVRMIEPTNEEMVALMKSRPVAIEERSQPSNDNYSPTCRVAYVESEVAGAIILELEPEAA